MGLFSSKTIIDVSSVAYNIAGDASERNNFLKQSLIFLNASEQSIGEKLPRMYLQSLGVKLKRAYKHAAALPQGLPTASMQLWEYQEFEDAVQTLLDIEHGPGKFKVEDAYITRGSMAPAIEQYLNQQYGWDSVTGLMASPPDGISQDAALTWKQGVKGKTGRSYSLEFQNNPEASEPDLVLNVPVANTTQQEMLVVLVSRQATSVRSDTTVSREFQTGDANDTTTTTSVSSVGARVTITTTTVTTTTDGTTTTVRTRIEDQTSTEAVSREYPLGTGEWPTLDSLWLSRANVEQTFFPSVPMRVDGVDMLDESHSEMDSYNQIRKQCSLMGMDALSIRNQLNENENIKDIDYAFIVAGANMNTESQAEMDYLFRFWDLCRERSTATETDHDAWVAQNWLDRSKPSTNTLVIQDPESKNGAYKITIEWDYIKKTLVTGVIGRPGHCSIITGDSTTYEFGGSNSRSSVDSTVVRIRRQLNDTQFEELAISGAVHKNDVYEGKVVETLAKDARADAEKHQGFIVPLHMGIFNAMPITKRTQLAQECIYLVLNCYTKRKQKWYQSGAFKWILAIVLVVITIMTAGTATPATASVWGAATLGALIGSVVIANLIMSFVIGYMASYLMGRWQAGFESVFGKKWAGVVMAVISIMVGMTTGGPSSSQNWLQSAVKIIDIATQLFTAYAKGAMVVMKDEYDAFMDKIEENKKLLDKLSSEFFGEGDLVSVDYLLQLQKTLREDNPTTFLARTLMTGSDIVDITLGQISEMVTLTTTPRLQGLIR